MIQHHLSISQVYHPPPTYCLDQSSSSSPPSPPGDSGDAGIGFTVGMLDNDDDDDDNVATAFHSSTNLDDFMDDSVGMNDDVSGREFMQGQ